MEAGVNIGYTESMNIFQMYGLQQARFGLANAQAEVHRQAATAGLDAKIAQQPTSVPKTDFGLQPLKSAMGPPAAGGAAKTVAGAGLSSLDIAKGRLAVAERDNRIAMFNAISPGVSLPTPGMPEHLSDAELQTTIQAEANKRRHPTAFFR